MPSKRNPEAIIKVCPRCGEMLIPLPGDYGPSCPSCTQKRSCGLKEIWYCPNCYYIEVKENG